jgi:hypothetical protein
MVLVDVNVMVKKGLVEANEVKAFDSHIEQLWLSSLEQGNNNDFLSTYALFR